MAWRTVMRRVPTGSLTAVGDLAQMGELPGPLVGRDASTATKRRWREERLTVNYRTPAEIMTVATDVLAAVAPDEHPPEVGRKRAPTPARSGPVLAERSARGRASATRSTAARSTAARSTAARSTAP